MPDIRTIMSLDERMRAAQVAELRHQLPYELVLAEIATLRLTKTVEYSEDRYEETDPEFGTIMLFSDVLRKFIRVKNLIKKKITVTVHETLRESFRDMANYCIMAVQELDRWAGVAYPPNEIMRVLGKATVTQTVKETQKFGWLAELGGRIEQVAFHVLNVESAISHLAKFGLTEWTRDTVTAAGTVYGHKGSNTANLAFNYQIGPVELELIRYVEGPNWLQKHDVGQLSHLGVHVENLAEAMRIMHNNGWDVVQHVTTTAHTNPVIRDSRRYTYVIYNTRNVIGFDVKLIKRLDYAKDPFVGNAPRREPEGDFVGPGGGMSNSHP